MSPIAGFITLALAAFAVALPAENARPPFRGPRKPPVPTGRFQGYPTAPFPIPSAPAAPAPGGPASGATCDASSVSLTVPPGQTAVPAPTGKLSFLMLGVGTQNYTCSSAGTYTSAGAVAELFDLSCLAAKSQGDFESAQSPSQAGQKLGDHYFVKNDAGGLSPVWDFRAGAAKGNPDAFVLAAKKGNTPAPTGSQDVDWLFLQAVRGKLAASIYRAQTVGGQPPSSCTAGTPDITVPYTSNYWLYDSGITL